MKTADQHNAAGLGQFKALASDGLRSKLLEQFEQAKPHLDAYHDYAERCMALSLEYHGARLKETLPGAPIEELTLAATLDARETPKSLDTKLAQIIASQVTIKRVIFDRVKSTYLLFA